MDSTALSLVVLGTLVFAAHVFSELFSRKRVPDLLLLLIIGIIIGPVHPRGFRRFRSGILNTDACHHIV